MDPIKEMLTQGASQVGMMNMQFVNALAGMATQTAAGMNSMATSMAASAPDLGAMVPAGMPGMPGLPAMPGLAPARGGVGITPAPVMAPAYAPRMIR